MMMITSVTNLMNEGKDAKGFADIVFSGLEYEEFDNIDISFKCTCSKEKYAKGLVSLGKKELEEMLEEKNVTTRCRFCNEDYVFSKDEIKELINKTTR